MVVLNDQRHLRPPGNTDNDIIILNSSNITVMEVATRKILWLRVHRNMRTCVKGWQHQDLDFNLLRGSGITSLRMIALVDSPPESPASLSPIHYHFLALISPFISSFPGGYNNLCLTSDLPMPSSVHPFLVLNFFCGFNYHRSALLRSSHVIFVWCSKSNIYSMCITIPDYVPLIPYLQLMQ